MSNPSTTSTRDDGVASKMSGTPSDRRPAWRRSTRKPAAALARAMLGTLILLLVMVSFSQIGSLHTRAGNPTTPAAVGSPQTCGVMLATPQPSPELAENETLVRFVADNTEILVRMGDNPTSRDLLSMLPLTLEFEDFASMEKLSYLPRELSTDGPTGEAPVNRDLIYFIPWGNLGFFYDAESRDASYDDRVIILGSIETGYESLDDLETGPVCVERVL